jgi:hypothetical protein
MTRLVRLILCTPLCLALCVALAQTVVDIPTRPGVTQRLWVLAPADPKAVTILFTGGNGALQISSSGELGSGKGNFLIRTRTQWESRGFVVILVDAPSDRQAEPFLCGFRQTPEHANDIQRVIAWARAHYPLPVWLIGTSRGTQSAAFVATTLSRKDGPDGLILTSTILNDRDSRPVTAMPLNLLTIPTLVVHHHDDACKVCKPEFLSQLMDNLSAAPRQALLVVSGGHTQGDPCNAQAYHGFNGIEDEVVGKIAQWILAP